MILEIFCFGKLYIIYVDRGTRFSSSDESDVSQFRTVGFDFPVFKVALDRKKAG
jgi:hypothetical protein